MPRPPTHPHKPPPALRLASRIHDLITQRHQYDASNLIVALTRLTDRLEQLARIRRHLALAREKGWRHAQDQLLRDLGYILRSLPGEATSAQVAIPQTPCVQSLADMAREFHQIDDEFGGWAYEAPDILLVATEPITLEDFDLGVFEIRLNLEHLGHERSSSPYEILARTPNPPDCNESIIHPHVRDGELCEGDATAPIKAALSEGRLCDFFLLVRSVLQTYNPNSAHVTLASWHGTPCHDCGYTINDDDDNSYHCEECTHDFCDNCISCCRSCDNSRCVSCLDDCPHCGESTCGACIKDCQDCDKPCCETCLKDALCRACVKQKNPEHKEPIHDDHHSIIKSAACAARHAGSEDSGTDDDFDDDNSYDEDPFADDFPQDSQPRLSIRARRRQRHRVAAPQAA